MDSQFLQWKLEQSQEVVRRLARISVDSVWAHRSSGVRGAMVRSIDRLERNLRGKARFDTNDLAELNRLLDQGYEMLVNAARELPFKNENRTL
jgi:hypothetical protein